MATLFRLVSEELGYAEVRIDANAIKWHTGLFKSMLPCVLSFLVSQLGTRLCTWFFEAGHYDSLRQLPCTPAVALASADLPHQFQTYPNRHQPPSTTLHPPGRRCHPPLRLDPLPPAAAAGREAAADAAVVLVLPTLAQPFSVRCVCWVGRWNQPAAVCGRLQLPDVANPARNHADTPPRPTTTNTTHNPPESVALKKTRGIEICTKWAKFESSVIIPLKELTAVTIQEVSDRRLLLTFQGRGERVHQAFMVRCAAWNMYGCSLVVLAVSCLSNTANTFNQPPTTRIISDPLPNHPPPLPANRPQHLCNRGDLRRPRPPPAAPMPQRARFKPHAQPGPRLADQPVGRAGAAVSRRLFDNGVGPRGRRLAESA